MAMPTATDRWKINISPYLEWNSQCTVGAFTEFTGIQRIRWPNECIFLFDYEQKEIKR